jgi:hypothetical protein
LLPKPAPCAPVEVLWTLFKKGESRTAKIRHEDGVGGTDLQLFANGGFFVSRRFPHSALAREEGLRWRVKYEAAGWRIS